MKYAFCILLFAFCFSCEKSDPVVENTTDDVKTFVIGYTGGWGGGPAYKLEDGQLFRSVADRNIGNPENIETIEFRLLEDDDKLQAMTALMAEFPATIFENVAPKFDCTEQAWDGTCPYLVTVTEKGDSKAWTRSEIDENIPFTDYLDDVSTLLQVLNP